MTDRTFPTQYTGASPPVASRTAVVLGNDGSSSGAIAVSAILPLLIGSDITAGGGLLASSAASTYAPLASPTFTGAPLSTTPTSSDNTTKIATTAFVKGQGYSTLVSPTFTGVPLAPTASAGTNTTQIATTAFVGAAIKPLTAVYKIMDTSVTVQWILLGAFTAAQAGDRCLVRIVSGRGYNASPTYHQISETMFTSSDGSSVDANGFAGSASWYKYGETNSSPSALRWVANAAGVAATSFSLYGNFDVFTGTNSFYEVTCGNGTWANSNTGGQTSPGVASSTVCIPLEEYAVTSPVVLSNNLTVSGGTISLASPTFTGTPIAPTAGTSTNTTQVATTAYVKAQGYATLASPTFTGTVIAPTVTPGTDNSTKIATTAFVQSAITSSGTFNAASVAITGGSIDGTTLGLSTASTGAFTSLSASTSFALSFATATTIPVLNGSKQLVSATLGSGLSVSGTTLSFVPASVIVTPASRSGAYTVQQSDNNATIYTSDSSGVTYTFPTLTAGTTIEIIQGAGGKVSWAASGTTINCPTSGASGSRVQWSAMRAKYLTSTVIVINGDVG